MNNTDPFSPSGPDPARDLFGAFVDGELDAQKTARLEALLRSHPDQAEILREELAFADLCGQVLAPHRSFQAFLDGLETRFHAEATADEFLADLLPRLREVDRKQTKRIVRFPVAWATGLAAAAALAVTGAVLFQGTRPGPDSSIAKLAQTSPDIVWAPAEDDSSLIEWKTGSPIPAGSSFRLQSGTARIELPNGNVLSVEGPAEFRLDSESEGSLHHGNLLATVGQESKPFTVRTPDMEFEVAGSTTGIRTLDRDGLEAAVLSDVGSVTAGSTTDDRRDAIGPREALVNRPQDGFREIVPVDLTAYSSHLNLLAGVVSHSKSVSVEIPHLTTPAPGPSPLTVTLERDGVESGSGLSVDFTPAEPLPLAHARTLPVQRRPDIAPGMRLRSYSVDTSSLVAPEASAGYVEAFIEFDQPILGIAATPDTLLPADRMLGASGAVSHGLSDADLVSVSADGRTLHLRLKADGRTELPNFRVFVQAREIALPTSPDRAWAAPPVNREEKPDLSGKAP